MDKIREKIRNIVLDNYKSHTDTFEYIVSKIFTLSFSNVDSSSISATKNGVAYSSANYSYNSVTGTITITASLTSGDILIFIYNSFQKYSNEELNSYIKNAIYHISINKYKTFTDKTDNIIFPTPTEDEENLIAIIASIIINGDVGSYRTNEVSITFNTKDSKETRIKKTIRNFKKTSGTFFYIDKNKPCNEETTYDRDNLNV
jgi:hypothetical protein